MVELQKWLSSELKNAGAEAAAFESKEILKQVFGVYFGTKTSLNSFLSEDNYSEERKTIFDMLERRRLGEPLQYIFGEWEFFGKRILCGKGVLIPRPETEILVEIALGLLAGRKNAKVLDLCCGTGCIGLTIGAKTRHKITLIDISDDAIALSNKNAELFGVKANILKHSVFDSPVKEQFDLLISNPPYIIRRELANLQREVQQEPVLALDGGEDGYDFYREIIKNWRHCIVEGGYIALEFGINQGEYISKLLADNGFGEIEIHRDYGKTQRIAVAKK